MIKIFNTLTKKKAIFKSINSGKISIYVCGVTVYDLCHIGHARTFIIFDTIVRYLRYCGYQVNYVRNITDIDDKIIEKARNNKESIQELTSRMIDEMYLDFDALNILRPNHEPKVTEYMYVIIEFIKLLIKNKNAYISNNGDVMFSVETMDNYGILSNIKMVKFLRKNNYIHNEYKKNIADFALWKKSKLDEPYWESPWGSGRPGWHIECSAMIYAVLGKYLDIHGGGSDLIFPHHDNEIAQSICAHNTFHVNTWMHSGMLSLYSNKMKMSKSSNNCLYIRDALKNYDSEVIRYFLMSAHYRNQLLYNNDGIDKAQSALKRLYIALRDIDLSNSSLIQDDRAKRFISLFAEKMNDDFNVPEAYAVLFKLAHELNRLKSSKKSSIVIQNMAVTLKYLGNLLGLLNKNPEDFLKKIEISNNIKKNVQNLIELRTNARMKNKWELADSIRKQLSGMGIKLEDESMERTKWSYDTTKK